MATVAAVALALPLAAALLERRASSLASIYRAESAHALAHGDTPSVVTEDDLMRVPPVVRWYLRRVGVVGRPRVRNLRARFHGLMRNGRDATWMAIRAEQVERFDEPVRLFHMKARQKGVPFEALHAFADGSASMRVRVLSVIPVVDARGPEMARSETVTFLNDMCLLAPASLLDAPIAWQTLDASTVEARFTSGGITVRARLIFDDHGDLATFVSDDRLQSSDGVTFRHLTWRTPVRGYRWLDGLRLPALADAIWDEPEGELLYAQFEVDALETNVGVRPTVAVR